MNSIDSFGLMKEIKASINPYIIQKSVLFLL